MTIRILEKGFVEFDGPREYDVVDRSLSPSPKFFISYNLGRPFISDEVPKEYRGFMVFHELTEFEKLRDSNDKCLNSLKSELEKVPEDKRKDYVTFRYGTFQNLIAFLEKYEPNSSFIPEARKSLDFLAQF